MEAKAGLDDLDGILPPPPPPPQQGRLDKLCVLSEAGQESFAAYHGCITISQAYLNKMVESFFFQEMLSLKDSLDLTPMWVAYPTAELYLLFCAIMASLADCDNPSRAGIEMLGQITTADRAGGGMGNVAFMDAAKTFANILGLEPCIPAASYAPFASAVHAASMHLKMALTVHKKGSSGFMARSFDASYASGQVSTLHLAAVETGTSGSFDSVSWMPLLENVSIKRDNGSAYDDGGSSGSDGEG